MASRDGVGTAGCLRVPPKALSGIAVRVVTWIRVDVNVGKGLSRTGESRDQGSIVVRAHAHLVSASSDIGLVEYRPKRTFRRRLVREPYKPAGSAVNIDDKQGLLFRFAMTGVHIHNVTRKHLGSTKLSWVMAWLVNALRRRVGWTSVGV